MNRAIQKTLAPISRKLGQIVSRGVLRLVDDSLKMQGLQVTLLADETLDGVERFQQYGFTSVPLAGAETINLSCNGNRSHSVCICVDDRRYRLAALQNGEVAIYTDENQTGEGLRLVLKRDRIIEVRCDKMDMLAETEIKMQSPALKIQGIDGSNCAVTLTGSIDATQDIVAGSANISLTTHHHGGVTTGSGQTGAPV